MDKNNLKDIEYTYLCRREGKVGVKWELDGLSYAELIDVGLLDALKYAAFYGWELVCKENDFTYVLKR